MWLVTKVKGMADRLDRTLKIERLRTIGELESIRPAWNALAADCPFRQWEWLYSWWEAFSGCGELYVLRATDHAGNVAGIAPWFLERSLARGCRVRQIGSGKACSDYQSLMTTPIHQRAVAEAMADWLIQAAQNRTDRWDELDLEAICQEDPVTDRMVDRLQQQGLAVEWRPQLSLLASSPGERLGSVRAGAPFVSQTKEIEAAATAIRGVGASKTTACRNRRRSESLLRQSGRLPSTAPGGETAGGMLRRTAIYSVLACGGKRFHSAGQLLLTRLEIDGQPAAANFCLVRDRQCSVYQCGMDPEQATHQPGWLLNVLLLRELIEQGFDCCDYLRGDERYKLDLGARPVGQRHLRVAAPHSIARLRHRAWVTQDRLRNWADPWVDAVRGNFVT